MNFSLWFSRRLKFSDPSGGGSNTTGVVIAVAGVALALIIMEFTLAIVTGFKHEITRRVMGFEGQVWVLPEYDADNKSLNSDFVPDATLYETIVQTLPDTKITQRYTLPSMLKTDGDFSVVYLNGYASDADYDFVRENIIAGAIPDFENDSIGDNIVVSSATADALGLEIGDKINTCFFINDAVKIRRYAVGAIYDSGFRDYDKTMAFAPISSLRKVAGADPDAVTQLSVSCINPDEITTAAAVLQQRLIYLYQYEGYEHIYAVDNVRHTAGMYFNWLDLLDTNVVVIFVLMLCVAGFTLISSMFIIILERISTIGILRSLGATKPQVRSIFINISMRIVGIGMLIGNILGISLLLIQKYTHIVPLDREMYYLDTVPVDINWWHMILLNIGVIIITWFVLILPSRLASGISPATTMRFE